jgi:type III restriction enzyme
LDAASPYTSRPRSWQVVRNLVGPQHFALQGHRRQRIYPDFVVQGGTIQRPVHRVMVVESKGEHLEGNPDTTYKRNVATIFDQVGRQVTWQQLGEDFEDHIFRFQILDAERDLARGADPDRRRR